MGTTILIAGGGTFGHIAPALALKKKFESENHLVYYACAQKDKRFPFYSKEKNILTVKLSGMPRKNPVKLLYFIFLLAISKWQAFWHIIKLKPKIIIATGGFVSFPYLAWAFLLRIPFFICEQNSFPGIVNRIFSRFAKKVFLSMKDFSGKLKGNLILTGNPVLINSYDSKDEAAKSLKIQFSENKTIIGVVGGSQGAAKINQWILNNQERLEKEGFQVLLSAGKASYNSILKEKKTNSIEVFDFIVDMSAFYSLSDIVICRAGASTLSEMIQLKKKAILIPYPFATDNHQYYNALFASEYLDSMVINEKDLEGTDLIQTLKKLISAEKNKDKKEVSDISESANKIYNEVLSWTAKR